MTELLRLEDIVLIPSDLNAGYSSINTFNYGMTNSVDRVSSLPIFTSPNPAIIDETNCEVFSKQGIRPVLPRSVDLNVRLEACQYVFASFSIEETSECFLSRGKRASDKFFFIAIDELNGGNCDVPQLIGNLKKTYGNQVITMAGPISNPKTYQYYCQVGADYVRLGGNEGSSVDTETYGYSYPMASLIQDSLVQKATTGQVVGVSPKIIADGGINSMADILKCLALGADYVMIGNQFTSLLESAGPILEKSGGKTQEIADRTVLTEADIHELDLYRRYGGLSNHEYQAKINGFASTEEYLKGRNKIYCHEDCHSNIIKIESTLEDWLGNFYNAASYAFIQNHSTNWIEFKKNAKFASIKSV